MQPATARKVTLLLQEVLVRTKPPAEMTLAIPETRMEMLEMKTPVETMQTVAMTLPRVKLAAKVRVLEELVMRVILGIPTSNTQKKPVQ